MSDWQQQRDNEEHHRWTLERGLARMERDVERGSALQRILAAEKAEREQQRKETSNGNRGI